MGPEEMAALETLSMVGANSISSSSTETSAAKATEASMAGTLSNIQRRHAKGCECKSCFIKDSDHDRGDPDNAELTQPMGTKPNHLLCADCGIFRTQDSVGDFLFEFTSPSLGGFCRCKLLLL